MWSRVEDLFRQHGTDATQFAFLMTGDKHVAEDLVQEAFVRVAGRFQDLRRPDAFRSYLRRTIVNLTSDYFRRLRRERAYLEGLNETNSTGEEAGNIELRHDLLRLLQGVPARQRAAVVLRHCLDLSEAEVADTLDVSISAAKSLVSRGLVALRNGLEESKDDEA